MESVASPTLTVDDGAAVDLPATVAVTYNDGSVEDVPVTWSDAVGWIRGPGTYAIPGTSAVGDVTATVTVQPVNALVNGSFETGWNDSWTFTGTGGSVKWSSSDSSDGVYAVNLWADSAYTFGVSQTVTGLRPGAYTLSAVVHGDGEAATDTMSLVATASGSSLSAPLELNGWQQWFTATVPVQVGADGTVTVGAQFALSANAWAWLDEFVLTPTASSGVDTSALTEAVAAASGVTRAWYDEASLTTLDHSLDVAAVVLAGSRVTASDVTAATAQVTSAVSGLVVSRTEGAGPGCPLRREVGRRAEGRSSWAAHRGSVAARCSAGRARWSSGTRRRSPPGSATRRSSAGGCRGPAGRG